MSPPPTPLSAIRDGFFQECQDHLEQLADALAHPGFCQPDSETVNAAFRAVHSIKGGAASLGLSDLALFAHEFESALDARRAGNMAAPLSGFLRAADHLASLVDRTRQAAPAPDGAAAILSALSADGRGAPLPDWQVLFRPRDGLFASGNEPLHLLNALAELGPATVSCDLSGLPPLDALTPGAACLSWSVRLPGTVELSEIREVFEFVEDVSDLSIARLEGGHLPAPASPVAADATPAVETPTVRVEMQRVDALVNLTGELIIGQSMLARRLQDAGVGRHSPLHEALKTMATLTRDLQEAVMVIRSQPLKPLFQRMGRILREASQSLDKPAELVCDGEMTEVDRAVIERLTDPLTHMVRNAIDHGIEDRARRRAGGKPETGRLTLSAAHRSGRVVISLADDGAGIDREKVRSLAVAKGLIAAESHLTDAEIDALIFHPGFSTATEVTALSGRGVGMDVVRTTLVALGGRITIGSAPGRGTRFTISLPLTLAVLNGMLVRVRGQTLVLPVTAIVETASFTPEAIVDHDLGLMRIRGRHLSVCDIGAVLGLPDPPDRREALHPVAILVTDEEDRQAVLVVDRIVDQQQVVIKALRDNCGAVAGIAAATILGDGAVALILDPADLITCATGPHRATPRAPEPAGI